MITESLSTLKIHKLTQEQYDRELAAGNIDEAALYLTPNEDTCAICYKSGTGTVIIDNIGPIEHELEISLESPDMTDFSEVQVTRTGKNWFDIGGENAGDWWQNGREFKRGTYVVGMSRTLGVGGHTIASDMYSFDGGTLRVTTSVDYYGIGFPRKLLPNTQYTFSAQVSDSSCVSLGYALCDNEGNLTANAGSWHDNKITFTTSETGNVMLVLTPTESDIEVTFSNVQLELGDTVTEYEPYKGEQTATANADGTVNGITSLYPFMTIVSDNPDVNINCEYFNDKYSNMEDKNIKNIARNTANAVVAELSSATLPAVTSADNGKVLMVVNGTWQVVNLNLTVNDDGTMSISGATVS